MIPTLDSSALEIEELVAANELKLAVLRLVDFVRNFAIQKRQRQIEAISLKAMYNEYQTEVRRNGQTQIAIHTANQIRQNILALLYNVVKEYQDKQRKIIEEHVAANELKLAVLRLVDFVRNFAIQKRQRQMEAVSLKGMYREYQHEVRINGKTQIAVHMANQIGQNILALLDNIVEESQAKLRNISETKILSSTENEPLSYEKLENTLNQQDTQVSQSKRENALKPNNDFEQTLKITPENQARRPKIPQISSAQKSEPFASDNRGDDAKRKNQRIIEALLDLINEIDPEFEIPKKSMLGIESPDFKQQSTESKPDMIQLQQILEERFNVSEVKMLCFHLGISYESIPGETLSDKARELILYFHRRNNLHLVTNKIHELRPDITF